MFSQVVPLDKEHDECIKFLMTIYNPEEVSRIPLGEDLIPDRVPNVRVGIQAEAL